MQILERMPRWSGFLLVALNLVPVLWVWWP